MSIRDEAVGAGATAILSRPIDAAGSVAGEAEADARVAIDAALAVLHPTVPNEIAALDRLPVGTVLRGVDQDGGVWIAWQADHGWWHDGDQTHSATDLARSSDDWGVDEWLVIYQAEGES